MDLIARLAADDRIPAYLELEQDVVFPHLTPAQRLRYVDFALDAGRREAAPHRGTPVAELCRRWGARLVIRESENRIAGLTVRAEHDTRTGTITLYQPSIAQVCELLNRSLPEPWTGQQVIDLHTAHELFHHLESTRIKPVHEQLPPVVTFRLGRFWETKSRARRCREIAAHAFAKELLGLPFLPNAVDWLLLLSLNKWSVDELEAALQRASVQITSGGIGDAANGAETAGNLGAALCHDRSGAGLDL